MQVFLQKNQNNLSRIMQIASFAYIKPPATPKGQQEATYKFFHCTRCKKFSPVIQMSGYIG